MTKSLKFFFNKRAVKVKKIETAQKTKGYWTVELVSGKNIAFYLDHEDNISPIERIEGFIYNENTYCFDGDFEEFGYPECEEDNSFYLVPKNDVKRIFFDYFKKDDILKK